MKITNAHGSIETVGSGRIAIQIGSDIRFRGQAGLVIFAGGNTAHILAASGGSAQIDRAEDRCGISDRLLLSSGEPGGITVQMVWSLYRDQPAVSAEMVVTNSGSQDIFLDRLVYFRGFAPEGGFDGSFPAWPGARILNQAEHWHFTPPHNAHLRDIVADQQASVYWNTVVGTDGAAPALALGIAEAARAVAEFSFRAGAGKVGLEAAAWLRTGIGPNRPLRIPPGASFQSHRIVFIPGENPNTALERYTDWVRRFLDLKLRFAPYAGLFAAYGSDPENRSPENIPLTEKRMEALMAVVDKYLQPYGLDTIKTQFAGFSSSRPLGTKIEQKLTAEQAKDPGTVRSLVDAIEEKGFAPDHYDSRTDFPHGIAWHVKQLAAEGYRAALVCRPFYNIRAGAAELDRAAADLFEMAVREWGYRYLMFDFISEDYESESDCLTYEQGIHARFKAVRDRVGPEVFIEACMVWPGPVLGVADGYRPAPDWRGCNEIGLIPHFAARNHYHGKFFQCDNEFMDPAIRPFTWRKPHEQTLLASLDRLRLWVGFNALLGYSYLAGAALERVEPNRWWIFQRGLPAKSGRATAIDFFDNTPPRLWIRPVSTPAGEFSAIGIFNWNTSQPAVETLDPRKWDGKVSESYVIFDFWAQEVYCPKGMPLPIYLAPFSGKIFHVHPTGDQPLLVGTSRHVTGQIGIEAWQWNPHEKTIIATFAGAPDSTERYWIWLPGPDGIEQCPGADLEVLSPQVIRLEIAFDASAHREVRIHLGEQVLIP